jgi:hypothetical protein
MGRVESLQEQVQALSRDELAQFRAWFLERDWTDWDVHFEDDVRAGRLDAIADQALRDHAAGKTRSL